MHLSIQVTEQYRKNLSRMKICDRFFIFKRQIGAFLKQGSEALSYTAIMKRRKPEAFTP